MNDSPDALVGSIQVLVARVLPEDLGHVLDVNALSVRITVEPAHNERRLTAEEARWVYPVDRADQLDIRNIEPGELRPGHHRVLVGRHTRVCSVWELGDPGAAHAARWPHEAAVRARHHGELVLHTRKREADPVVLESACLLGCFVECA